MRPPDSRHAHKGDREGNKACTVLKKCGRREAQRYLRQTKPDDDVAERLQAVQQPFVAIVDRQAIQPGSPSIVAGRIAEFHRCDNILPRQEYRCAAAL